MAQGRPVDDATRARMKVLHAAGKSRNEIARELGISSSTVTKICRQLSLSFERAATAAATAARVLDAKARRAALADRGYKRAEALYARLEAAKFKTLVKQFGGAEVPETLDFVPPPNERDLAQSISTHMATVARLEALDTDNGASDAKSLLAELGKSLGVTSPTDS